MLVPCSDFCGFVEIKSTLENYQISSNKTATFSNKIINIINIIKIKYCFAFKYIRKIS